MTLVISCISSHCEKLKQESAALGQMAALAKWGKEGSVAFPDKCTFQSRLTRNSHARITEMKHLFTGIAVAAALAIAAPVWAQNPNGGNSMGNPAPAAAPVQSMNRMPAGGRATSERGATGSVTRAHHRRHAAQAASAPSAGTSADELNRQELSQLQSGNPTTMNRMSVGGKATSGGPNQ